MNTKGKNLLITGGNGFLGKYVTKKFCDAKAFDEVW